MSADFSPDRIQNLDARSGGGDVAAIQHQPSFEKDIFDVLLWFIDSRMRS